jgi:hypothetical protein
MQPDRNLRPLALDQSGDTLGEIIERTIRVPPRIIETVNKVARTTREMLPEIGREPTPRSSRNDSRCRSTKCSGF